MSEPKDERKVTSIFSILGDDEMPFEEIREKFREAGGRDGDLKRFLNYLIDNHLVYAIGRKGDICYSRMPRYPNHSKKE